MSVITAVALKTGHLQAKEKIKLFPEFVLCFGVLGIFQNGQIMVFVFCLTGVDWWLMLRLQVKHIDMLLIESC